jgi:hypothetical protein
MGKHGSTGRMVLGREWFGKILKKEKRIDPGKNY